MSAVAEWEDLRMNTHYPLTRRGFVEAWTKACGKPPTPKQIDDFVEHVTVTVKRANAEIRKQQGWGEAGGFWSIWEPIEWDVEQ